MAGLRIKDEDVRRPKPESSLAGGSIMASSSSHTINDIASALANVRLGDKAEHKHTGAKTDYMDQLVSKSSVHELEAGVKIGHSLLESLKTPLRKILTVSNNSKASTFLDAVQQLQDSAKPSRTVVGVVGNTGAGKSSLINALLDEEMLVPTNGMRACTCAATEISYNDSDDPSELYRAEVEFISLEDWVQELETLLNNLLDGNGHVSRDCTNPDTDAGLAFCKLKAVYPNKTKEMMADCTAAILAEEPGVRSVLGRVQKLGETTCLALFDRLQTYVDRRDQKGSGLDMECWPLIKVVRIYCKSPVLKTGVVMVDLPGVQDSNAARSAVSDSYMKNCTGLWIIAAIQRAVDEKTAKTLLGNSFKRQLKYDGQFNCVTFICTKTDDILETEVARGLPDYSEIKESWGQVENLRERLAQLRREVGDLNEQRSAVSRVFDDLDFRADQFEELRRQLTDGNPVYRPSRTRCSSIDSRSDDSSSHNSDEDENRLPLTRQEIEEELVTCKTRKKQLQESKKELGARLKALKRQETELLSEVNSLSSRITSGCIKGRNEFSRSAIKRDFAMGIKELDQAAAIVEDDSLDNPDQDFRDYDEVERRLPVFCVSARAYQKLSGRLKKDTVNVGGFPNPEDTEIPHLQEHAKKLTEGGRASRSRFFLNELIQLLNRMKLWTTDDDRILDQSQRNTIEDFLQSRLTTLRQDLHIAVQDCFTTVQDVMVDQLHNDLDRLAPVASTRALDTSTGWGGDLHWNTYRATCKGDGVFRRNDWNAQLIEPIMSGLAGSWERVFQRDIPSAFDAFAKKCKLIIGEFHNDVMASVRDSGRNPASIQMMNQQLRTYAASLLNISKTLGNVVIGEQRDANRRFKPAIQKAMKPAYGLCASESQDGMFKRMKGYIHDHVELKGRTMFRNATQDVQEKLQLMCEDIELAMINPIDELAAKMKHDYLAVLVGENAQAQASIPRAECLLRNEMFKLLVEADSWFAELFPAEEAIDKHTPIPQDGIKTERL